MSAEPTLGQLLANLTEAVAEYQGVVNKMFAIQSDRIDLCDRMVVELRDDTHESFTALSNRIEAVTPTLPYDVARAEYLKHIAQGGFKPEVFRCNPDESGGVRDADA